MGTRKAIILAGALLSGCYAPPANDPVKVTIVWQTAPGQRTGVTYVNIVSVEDDTSAKTLHLVNKAGTEYYVDYAGGEVTIE